MEKNAKIYVAGATTLVGAAIRRRLERGGYENFVGEPGDEPDLTDVSQVDAFFNRASPDYVFVAAGKSGGIRANQKYQAEMMRDNLLVACNLIHSSYHHRIKKLLYLASSCAYPRHCPQPMRVDSLLTGPLEPTSEAYALAKLAGIKLCQAYRLQYGAKFICGISADAFGPGDDFSLEDSHVVSALIRRIHEAKVAGAGSVAIWGTGAPKRDFIFVDDLADACIVAMNKYDDFEPINLGAGNEVSIKELAKLVREVVGYDGEFEFDTTKPDGMPLKVLDARELRAMGWSPRTPLRSALGATYEWFLQNGKQDYETVSH